MPEVFQVRIFFCRPEVSISSVGVKGVVMGKRMPRRLSRKRSLLEVAGFELSAGLFKRRDYSVGPDKRVIG